MTESISKIQSPSLLQMPAKSPDKQLSPQFFPPQPCTAHGLNSGLVQTPSPSHTPSEHDSPHSFPLHSLESKIGARLKLRKL